MGIVPGQIEFLDCIQRGPIGSIAGDLIVGAHQATTTIHPAPVDSLKGVEGVDVIWCMTGVNIDRADCLNGCVAQRINRGHMPVPFTRLSHHYGMG